MIAHISVGPQPQAFSLVAFSIHGVQAVSHTLTIKTEIRDFAALSATCRRLKLAQPTQGEVRLFDRVATGIGVQLDGWRFPVCIEIDGNLLFDNFGGFWGNPENLGEFQQIYAIEKATIEARKQGHSCQESLQTDGSIHLFVTLGV